VLRRQHALQVCECRRTSWGGGCRALVVAGVFRCAFGARGAATASFPPAPPRSPQPSLPPTVPALSPPYCHCLHAYSQLSQASAPRRRTRHS